MGLRPAKCYRSVKDRPYTRLAVKVHDKNYIGTSPAMKIRQFNMGNPLKDFSHVLDMIVLSDVLVRDNAIESIRIAINKYLTKELGKENYFMKIRVYPSHILRENKIAQGAGADRISTGMSHSFGVPIGRAVRAKKGMILLSVLADGSQVEKAKKGMLRANPKLPTRVKIKIHTDVQSIGTKPNKVREIEEKKEETKVEPGKEGEKAATPEAGAKPEDAKGKKEAAPAKVEKKGKK